MYYLEQETQNLKKKYVLYRKKQSRSLCCPDHYTNIKKKFIYKRKIIKPKKIIIFDNTVYQKLKIEFLQ